MLSKTVGRKRANGASDPRARNVSAVQNGSRTRRFNEASYDNYDLSTIDTHFLVTPYDIRRVLANKNDSTATRKPTQMGYSIFSPGARTQRHRVRYQPRPHRGHFRTDT